MKIRQATVTDLPAVVSLFVHHEMNVMKRLWKHIDEIGMKAQIQGFHDTSHAIILVAEKDNELVGFFTGVFTERVVTGELMFVEVHWYTRADRPSAGLALKREAEQVARENGAKIMLISVPNKDIETILTKSGYAMASMVFEKRL
jgi:hypothetical protein